MLIIFQILFTLFALAAIFAVGKRKKEQLLGNKGVAFWGMFWVLAIVVVFNPESATGLAEVLGIGRGVDLIIYISIALIFFILFRLHIKIESTARNVTKVVRHNAVHGKQNHK